MPATDAREGGGLTTVLAGVVGPATAASDPIFIPAAFAIFLSSFSSRLRSFSFRLSASSFPAARTGWWDAMSRARTLWWCAYEFVCSSYCATFANCLSQ